MYIHFYIQTSPPPAYTPVRKITKIGYPLFAYVIYGWATETSMLGGQGWGSNPYQCRNLAQDFCFTPIQLGYHQYTDSSVGGKVRQNGRGLGRPPSYAEAEKAKWLTLHICLSVKELLFSSSMENM